MAEFSTRWTLPLLQAGQAQKEVTHNEALILIDALTHPLVQEAGLATPPVAPLAGQCWIIGSSASGIWSGRDNQLACYTAGGWRYLQPAHGALVWLADQQQPAWFDGAMWQSGPWPSSGLAVGGVQVVGAQQTAIAAPAGGSVVDVEARAGLTQVLTALRNHGLIAS